MTRVQNKKPQSDNMELSKAYGPTIIPKKRGIASSVEYQFKSKSHIQTYVPITRNGNKRSSRQSQYSGTCLNIQHKRTGMTSSNKKIFLNLVVMLLMVETKSSCIDPACSVGHGQHVCSCLCSMKTLWVIGRRRLMLHQLISWYFDPFFLFFGHWSRDS